MDNNLYSMKLKFKI